MKRFHEKVLLFRTIILLILIRMILASNIYGQEQDIEFKHISAEQGLSVSSIRCIFQDSRGFMWFGTEEGLNRYDGYNFTVYKNDPLDSNSLSYNWISTICEDSEGILWIGTSGSGLNQFDPEKGTFKRYKHDENNPSSLSHNEVRCIYEDRSGVLWIGTYGGGLCRMNRDDPEKKTFTHYKHEDNNPNSLSHDAIRCIHEDGNGMLWIGTEAGGVNKFDRETETFMNYLYEDGNPNSLRDNNITAIAEDRSGRLWIGTFGKGISVLNRDDPEGETFTHYEHEEGNPHSLSDNEIRVIFKDRSGVIWIGTRRSGLNKFLPAPDVPGGTEQRKEKFEHWVYEPGSPSSLSDNYVVAIYEDRSGILWIGTRKHGLNKFDWRKKSFKYWKNEPDNPNSLSSSHVMAICEGSLGELWVGTKYGGLCRINRENMTFTHYTHEQGNLNSLNSNRVLSICEDRSGMIWLGTEKGLSGVNRDEYGNVRFTHYRHEAGNPNSLSHNYVRTVFEDRSGVLWVGTRDGLSRLNREEGTFTNYKKEVDNPYSLIHSSIRAIYEDRSGILWIGTDRGLSRLNRKDREKGRFRHYKEEEGNSYSLSDNKIRSIHEDRSGVLWIGTRGGLNKFDRETEQFTRYTEKEGLPSNVIYGILEDDRGNLWMSTNSGLSRFNPQAEKFRNYDVDDGLQHSQFAPGAYHKSKKGEMFFGGINGFNAFYPDNVRENLCIPPIVITTFRKFGEIQKMKKDICEMKEIKLSHKDNYFSFEFAALDYVNPLKNQYAYKLGGFDSDWIFCGTRRYSSYTNLHPGHYTFKVKGSNNDGVWNEEGVSIRIVIVPPFWQAWWFKIFGVLVVLGVAYGAHKIRVVSIEIRRRKLEIEVGERTSELEQKKNEVENSYSKLAEVNALLKQEIAERKRVEKQIKTSLSEKEVLLKEIHHRVKNNLQVISSLLNLQSRHIKDKQALDMFRDSQDRVRSIAIVHERLYHSQNLAEIDFTDYIKSLTNSLYRSYGINPERVGLEIKVKDVSLSIDLAVPCGLIVNELVSNALKHAFPLSRKGKGKIEVSLCTVEDNEIELTVIDNGVGLPEDLDFRKTDSLGLYLVGILVEDQLQGQISLDGRKGAKFRIRFKRKEDKRESN